MAKPPSSPDRGYLITPGHVTALGAHVPGLTVTGRGVVCHAHALTLAVDAHGHLWTTDDREYVLLGAAESVWIHSAALCPVCASPAATRAAPPVSSAPETA